MPEAGSDAASWTAAFDNREKAEIALSRIYIRDFNHGTDGHSAKVIIAKMADGSGSIPNDLTVIANKKPVQADKVHVI